MKITCRVCGRETDRIVPAHVRTHGLSLAEYRAMYPDAPLMSEESRARLCAAQKAAQSNPETRARISASCKGVPKTPEWNRKNSEAQKGRTYTEEEKAQFSASAKVRIARDGNPMDRPGVKEKLAAVKQTPEYQLHYAQGQAAADLRDGRDGLNVKVAHMLDRMGVAYDREVIVPGPAPWRYDFAFLSRQVLVEVHGCRWHFCPEHPKAHVRLTEQARKDRDRKDRAKATYAATMGYTLITLWEHELLSARAIEATLSAKVMPVIFPELSEDKDPDAPGVWAP